jgi:hypothetical protein
MIPGFIQSLPAIFFIGLAMFFIGCGASNAVSKRNARFWMGVTLIGMGIMVVEAGIIALIIMVDVVAH